MKIHNDTKKNVEAMLKRILPEIVEFRQKCHSMPELTWQEEQTAARVAAELKLLDGVTVTEKIGKLGVVGLIEGAHKGPTVALRADMDALPMTEETGLEYASSFEGKMHSCGHDGHMANLLGAAKILSEMKGELHGKVKLIFQPAEEGGAGADAMVKDGVLEGVDVIFGLHGWPQLGCGKIYTKTGSTFAANADFEIVVTGEGCHAAMPHLGTDQILIASRIVESAQSIISRTVSPATQAALTISTFHGGTATNIIPPKVRLSGTMRATSRDILKVLHKKLEDIVSHVTQAAGAKGELSVQYQYPEVRNHVEPTAFINDVATEILGADHVSELPEVTMGAEDFSFYLEKIPGTYFLLGVDDGRQGGFPSLHHPKFDFNDKALETGIRVFVHAALSWHTF